MKYLILISLIISLIAPSSLLAGGGQEGIGGDSMVWEFKSIGQSIYFWLGQSERKLRSGLQAAPFFTVLNAITIESTDDPAMVTVNGAVKEAVSYLDEKKVVLYRPYYRKIDSEKKKWLLVVHEISHFLAQSDPLLDDKDYKVSSEVVRQAFPELLRPSDFFGSMIDCARQMEFPTFFQGTKQGIRMFIDPATGLVAIEYYLGDFFLSSHYRVRLADRLICYYSKTKGGLIQCQDFGNPSFKSEFSVVQVDRQNADAPHAFTQYELWISSPEVRRLYNANRFHFVPAENTILSPQSRRSSNLLGETTIPLFPDIYTWAQGMTFTRDGSRGLGSLFRMNFKAGECQWRNPK